MRRNLSRDLGDFFGFEVIRIVPLQEEAKGSRVHVRASLGAKTFAVFHIDVVVGTAMSGEPDEVAPLTPLHVDGLVRPSYRAFPLPDHVADKFAAILGTHVRGEKLTGSSRIKDLVDIALIATTQQISGPALRAAILARRCAPEPVPPRCVRGPRRGCMAARLPEAGGRCAWADANLR